jgi:hypothetical protein
MYGKFDKVTLETMAWEIMNHPPYSPDLAPVIYFIWTKEGASRGTEISN